jgi:ubiquinone/menaquinone biosynthesis C-methylase UbiE
MDRSESIRSQFSAAADRYTRSRYHADAPDLAAMLEAVTLRGDERVLDVGTGTGHTALAFAPAVAEVVALDLTPAMLDEARRLAADRGVDNVRFERGDAMALPFPDESFDLVTCRVCAHHFESPAPAVREAARVLRPGGTFLLVDSVSPEDPAQDTFLNCIEVLRDPSHVRNYSVSQWRTLLDAAGFESECLAVWPVPLPFDDWVERMRTPELERRQLRRLFETATDAIRETFDVKSGETWGFSIPIGFLRCRRRGGEA